MGFFTLPHVPLKGQNVVFDNGGVAFPSPFLTSWPNYPTLLNTNKLQLGFGYPMRTNRFDVYGGGIRNGFLSTTGLGGYYMKWQQQNFWGLNLGTSAAPAGFTYYPGIRYLGNRHNWFGYAATFGLKERISNQILDNPEAMHITIVENYEQKDAVITMEYPNTIDESKRPNLVFESIALDSNIGGSGDVITQLATLTNSGNLGFRTADPQARIEIYGDAGLTTTGSLPKKAISVRYPTSGAPLENFVLTTSNTGSLMGFGTSSSRWQNLHLSNQLDFTNGSYLSNGSGMVWKGNILPYTNGVYILGNSSTRWKEIWCTNALSTTSDLRLKKDLKPIDSGLQLLLRLKPVTYFWKETGIDSQLHYGFVAQDLKPIFTNSIVVGNASKDTLAVRYSEFIPILTKAIQEQQKIIQELKELKELLVNTNTSKLITNSANHELNKLPILFQNNPNPFNKSTFIDYFIPNISFQAAITVSDNSGKLVYSFVINKTGFGRVILDDNEIRSGIYYYSLLVDGKTIDTKKMEVVKN